MWRCHIKSKAWKSHFWDQKSCLRFLINNSASNPPAQWFFSRDSQSCSRSEGRRQMKGGGGAGHDSPGGGLTAVAWLPGLEAGWSTWPWEPLGGGRGPAAMALDAAHGRCSQRVTRPLHSESRGLGSPHWEQESGGGSGGSLCRGGRGSHRPLRRSGPWLHPPSRCQGSSVFRRGTLSSEF